MNVICLGGTWSAVRSPGSWSECFYRDDLAVPSVTGAVLLTSSSSKAGHGILSCSPGNGCSSRHSVLSSNVGSQIMSKQIPANRPMCHLLPTGIEGFDSLAELALDMHWSWNHATDEVWRQLDTNLWEMTHNPWVVLQTGSHDRIKQVLADPVFRKDVDSLVEASRQTAEAPAWFQRKHSDTPLTCVAYFSMEFMLSEALPIYSGGLGNVAGDQLKAASDLGVPVVGVGLLYQQGYFRQVIDKDGEQQALYPFNDPGQLPITPVRQPNGEWLRLEIALPGYSVWLRAWQVQVGRVRLYLLDSNDAANYPAHRGITSELYGGGPELRLKQEMVLGLGGWRLLPALDLTPEICHLNEGHAAFAVLERAHNFMEETGHPFEVALAVTRAGNLFTTHTAVAAGFDRFSPALMAQYLGGYAEKKIGIPLEGLLALGRENPADSSEPFNMAYLAIRGSGSVNGVSRLHGKVSRRLFQPLLRILTNSQHPVQLIIAGKAHPADQAGRALIREWMHFIRRPEVRPHAVFLSDYDMLLTEHLVQGVDVWINTPRRPWEACGTSGMKVLVNGGINLSELDGWWAEAYTPELGWALGDGQEHGDDPAWDAVEAEALYDLLERDVIPEFYARGQQDIPTAWVARMRNSMASLTPRFSADRAVREYTERHYLPGAAAYRERAAGKGSAGLKMVDWQHALEKEWPALHFGTAKVETNAGQRVFEIEINLHELDPAATRVELYADGLDGGGPVRQQMERVGQLAGACNGCTYRARVSAERPATDYTARLIPSYAGAAVPLESLRILWQ